MGAWLRPLVALGIGAWIAPAGQAQATLYVAFGSQINAYNPSTGAFVTAPLVTGVSLPWQMAIDSGGNIYTALQGMANVDVYQGTSGSVVAANLLGNHGVSSISGLAVQGNNLYAASQSLGRISLYNATTGALINANFISGLATPEYLLLDGAGRLFVSNGGSASIGVYDAATGATINASFISGVTTPMGLALDAGNRLYVASVQANAVAVYDASSGGLLTSSLIAGLSSPRALAVDASGSLYVSSFASGNGTYLVGRYDGLTGVAQRSTLLAVGSSISSLGFSAVPEPSVLALLGVSLTLLALVSAVRAGRRGGRTRRTPDPLTPA